MNSRTMDFIEEILAIVGLIIIFSLLIIRCTENNKKPIIEDTQEINIILPPFYNKSAEEGLLEALDFYNVDYKEIVYAQAVLETGYFKSKVCKEYNNLFGLYDSKTNDYFKYNNWVDCLIAYVKTIQSKYTGGDYYEFLNNLGYAEDPEYTNKLKRIVKREFNNGNK